MPSLSSIILILNLQHFTIIIVCCLNTSLSSEKNFLRIFNKIHVKRASYNINRLVTKPFFCNPFWCLAWDTPIHYLLGHVYFLVVYTVDSKSFLVFQYILTKKIYQRLNILAHSVDTTLRQGLPFQSTIVLDLVADRTATRPHGRRMPIHFISKWHANKSDYW